MSSPVTYSEGEEGWVRRYVLSNWKGTVIGNTHTVMNLECGLHCSQPMWTWWHITLSVSLHHPSSTIVCKINFPNISTYFSNTICTYVCIYSQFHCLHPISPDQTVVLVFSILPEIVMHPAFHSTAVIASSAHRKGRKTRWNTHLI